MTGEVFQPRIVNPVKFKRAVVLAADEEIRTAAAALAEAMPWTNVEIARDPWTVSNSKSDEATVFLLDDTALIAVDTEAIRRGHRDAVLVLLSSNDFVHHSPPGVASGRYPYTEKADLVFAVGRDEFAPAAIIAAAARCAEDFLNIGRYARERRYIFLLVDDEPRWFSQFLPVLYAIIGQRADVRLARTYEEAIEFLFGPGRDSGVPDPRSAPGGHGDDVVCLIADVYFPKGSKLDGPAGKDLVRLVRGAYPRVPIVIASKAREALEMKGDAWILPKGDPGSLEILRHYIHDYTGLGDFLVQNPDGRPLARIKNIYELRDLMARAANDDEEAKNLRVVLETYAKKDYFSTWLYMHGFRTLGDVIRPRQDRGLRLVRFLFDLLEQEIGVLKSTPLIVEGFRVSTLADLRDALLQVDPGKIQPFSDNDVFSTWLDRRGYSELAEDLRPIHGSGPKLREALVRAIEKRMDAPLIPV
jgi:hypothetical protein